MGPLGSTRPPARSHQRATGETQRETRLISCAEFSELKIAGIEVIKTTRRRDKVAKIATVMPRESRVVQKEKHWAILQRTIANLFDRFIAMTPAGAYSSVENGPRRLVTGIRQLICMCSCVHMPKENLFLLN